MVDRLLTMKGLDEAKHLIEQRIPERFRGRALYALGEAITMLTPAETEIEIEGGGSSWSSWWYVCPVCHTAIDRKDNYCRECGQAVITR